MLEVAYRILEGGPPRNRLSEKSSREFLAFRRLKGVQQDIDGVGELLLLSRDGRSEQGSEQARCD